MTAAVRLASPHVGTDVRALAGLRFTWRHDEAGEAGDLETFTPAFGQWWQTYATTHLGFLSEVGGRPVGMGWLGIIQRTPGPEQFRRQAGMIQSVYVLPSARGHGVGAAIVHAAIDVARERGLDYLMVHPTELSFPVYERAGFARSSGVLELGLTAPRRPA